MKKFNPKVFQDKDRVYPPVAGAPNIRRIYIWDEARKEYRPPSRGKIYVARRYEIDAGGKKKRMSGYFESLEDARNWQSFIDSSACQSQPNASSPMLKSCPTFQQIMLEWRVRKFPTLRKATRIQYQALSDRHFQMLSDFPINAITSKDIDAWLADRKANLGDHPQAKRRLSFDRELMILSLILEYYGEYYEEDTSFRLPVKKRHWRDSKLNVPRISKKKDVKEEEFQLFRVELEKLKEGSILKHLATTQFYQALRISEVAAMKWKHVFFNREVPHLSRIQIDQHVVYGVEKGEAPTVEPGFKNSDSLSGIKELPMFPQTFKTLSALYGDGVQKGPEDYVFPNEHGDFFRYHTVRNRYNRAFKLAGFKYTATHVMRHGWTNEIFNATGGDYGIAGQLLGDVSDKAIKTYAKRAKTALTNLAHEMWQKGQVSELVAIGRK